MIERLEGVELVGDNQTEIEQIEYDSRLIKKNALFFAIRGYQLDGYDFIPQAVTNGAVAVLGEQPAPDSVENYVRVPNVRRAMTDVAATFYGEPGKRIKACGVTGTNGKTTTCHLLKKILEARNKTTGLVTSQVYDTGREVFSAERTTPESVDLQRLLYLMKRNYCVNAVIEVSSHALMLHRVDNIDFRVAVYTNLTRDHLDFHGTMEKYFETKKQLAMKLKGPLSYVVFNLDVEEFYQLTGDINCAYISYALEDKKADVRCGDCELKPDGTVFDLIAPMGTITVHYKLPGRFNLQNALAAAAGGMASGVDLDNVVKGLESAEPITGRLNPVRCGQPFAVYVDYAHTPDAIVRLCQTVKELNEGKLLLLFGCGGDRDRGKRPMMGKAATENADWVVVSTDNPRSEDPAAIVDDIKPGLVGNNYEIELDRKEAIGGLLRSAAPGDAVLLAGKGAEDYQEIKGERYPFSDVDEARACLAQMGFTSQEINEEI